MKTCTWAYDDILDCWETSCEHQFIISEGTLEENKFKFCPFCGGAIREKNGAYLGG